MEMKTTERKNMFQIETSDDYGPIAINVLKNAKPGQFTQIKISICPEDEDLFFNLNKREMEEFVDILQKEIKNNYKQCYITN